MSSTSETGHAKNLANFETEISFCTAYGEKYKPSKRALSINELNNLLKKAQENFNTVTNEKNQYDLAVNKRQVEFEPVKPLATRIINSLEATEASQKTIDDAKTINKQIQGGRVSAKPSPKSGRKSRMS